MDDKTKTYTIRIKLLLWKLEWLVKFPFPCMYYSEYIVDGQRMVNIWRSWLGFTLWERVFKVSP